MLSLLLSSLSLLAVHVDGYIYEAELPEPCPAGSYRRGPQCLLCPSGTYGARDGLVSPTCDGLCSPGFYCPAGSTRPTQVRCPAGRYGRLPGSENDQCTGESAPGFFALPGSTSATQNRCGGPNYYCPAGSGHRIEVTRGWYTTGTGIQAVHGNVDSPDAWGLGGHDITNATRDAQAICEAGSYCEQRTGVRQPCPPGTYGETEGLFTKNCTAPCPAGFYCPEGSVRPIICPAGRYGAVAALSAAGCSGACKPGYYCPAGSTRVDQVACPAGSYGGFEGLGALVECHGACRGGFCDPSACAPGHFCPTASDSATEVQCGGSDRFCPGGSATPTPVSTGHYTVGGEDAEHPTNANLTRSGEKQCEPGSYCVGGVKQPCPPGRYGSAFGLASAACSGPCRGGYTCPEGSSSDVEVPCGASQYFCPEGSGTRSTVQPGYYTVGGGAHARVNETLCGPPGDWCSAAEGLRRPCPPGRYGETAGLSQAGCTAACPRAHYCPEGSPAPTPCPAGTYGDSEGLTTSACSGPCSPGYYCPVASASHQQHECGGEHAYCPLGSPAPVPVEPGFYAAGGNVNTRHGQRFCDVDTSLGYQCPSTTIALKAP